ncbi:MAG: hypothetical protein P8Y58_09440, partial [Novosphingobium sp.]
RVDPKHALSGLQQLDGKELAGHMRLASIKDTSAAADLPGWIEFFQNAWDKGEEHKHDTEAILDHTNAKIEKMKERRAARKENRGPSEETLRHTSLRLPPRPSKVFAHGR